MTPLPLTPETAALARRLIWFEPPEQALADTARFLAYALEYARIEDLALLRRHVSEADLRAALAQAPPGIIRPRSWTFWHLRFGQYPPPPLPQRVLA